MLKFARSFLLLLGLLVFATLAARVGESTAAEGKGGGNDECQIIDGRIAKIPHDFFKLVELDVAPRSRNYNCNWNVKSFGYEAEIPASFPAGQVIPWRSGLHKFSDRRLTVGVNVGDFYENPRVIETQLINQLKVRGVSDVSRVKGFLFENGLQELALADFARRDTNKDSFYVGRENGQLIAYIVCSNKPVRNPPCRHYFIFRGVAKIGVYLQYSREHTPAWRGMQDMINSQLSGFFEEK